MYYKYMDLFHLCHSCLEAYRSGRKYFILCVTLSSKEDAIFPVIHFSYFIDNGICFFQRFLLPRSDVKKNCCSAIPITMKPKIDNFI